MSPAKATKSKVKGSKGETDRELLPCPFCGSSATLMSVPNSPAVHWISCDRKKCRATMFSGRKKVLFTRWNRRHGKEAV